MLIHLLLRYNLLQYLFSFQMGTGATKCCDYDPSRDQQIKLEVGTPSKSYAPIEKVSPKIAVTQRYKELKGDDSWLQSKTSYKLQDEKGVYYGEVSEGVPNGFGRLLSADGSFYEGQFFNGVAHTSQGLYIYTDGSYYFGEIRNNKAEGKGTFAFKLRGELTYEGEWIDDMPHGKGVETLIDGSHYEGEYSCGVKQGKGIFVWPNGDRYKGDFEGGIISGQGSFESSTGYRYVGGWMKNKKSGQGTEYFTDGRIINCKFLQGSRIGTIKVTAKGATIEGKEENGKFIAYK